MQRNAEAIFNSAPVLEIGQNQIEELKRNARQSPRGRFRLCMHGSTEDAVQQMVIALAASSYCRPHCHPHTSATLQVLEGEVSFMIFDAKGDVSQRIELGAPGTGKAFCVRVAPGVWHMDIIQSATAVILETMAGPFVRENSNVFAPWAPPEEDADAVARFIGHLTSSECTQEELHHECCL